MEHVTTDGGIRRGTLKVRSLRELQDSCGARIPAAAAIASWTRKLMASNTQDGVLVFLLDEAERVRAVQEIAPPCEGTRWVREAFRAAIVFDATQIVLVYGSRCARASEASSETGRLLRRVATLLGISIVVMVRATEPSEPREVAGGRQRA